MASDSASIVRIGVRIQVGKHLMAASDDPLFLGLRGPAGREFRLRLAKGRSLRRGSEDHYVLGAGDDAATNVAQPELNDPTRPRLAVGGVESVYLRKGQEPIPNVRGTGEMDDRLEVERAEVEIESDSGTVRFVREGPIWLGLEAGQLMEIPRVDGDG